MNETIDYLEKVKKEMPPTERPYVLLFALDNLVRTMIAIADELRRFNERAEREDNSSSKARKELR